MAKKTHFVEGIGEVKIQRRRGMKSVRLRIDPHGQVSLSMPRWASMSRSLDFLVQKKSWIKEEKGKIKLEIEDGAIFGNDYRLKLIHTQNSRIFSKFSGRLLTVHAPSKMPPTELQSKLYKIISRTIKVQAEANLLKTLNELSKKHALNFHSASVGLLKSRWGSCDERAHIKLNAYLIQLPDHLIEYVILHELNHTKHMNHSRSFWNDMKLLFPDTPRARKELKTYSPRVYIK